MQEKGTQSTVHCLKCYDNFHIYYLNVADPLIISLILFFLPCENARANNKFSCENSKPRCELQITIC